MTFAIGACDLAKIIGSIEQAFPKLSLAVLCDIERSLFHIDVISGAIPRACSIVACRSVMLIGFSIVVQGRSSAVLP